MNKHTPGNWYVAERTMWHAEVRFVRTSEDKSGVVGLTSDRDAKLVAAAPDLLTALTNLLNWGREHTSPTDPNSPHELLVAAHEAIEKAGGSVPDGENAGCDDCGMHDRVPGDGDGLVDDGKPTERPASKESMSDDLDTRLSFEHQKALGEYIGGNIGDSVRPKRVEEITGGIDASQMITGDDQNMIMLYAGVLGDDDVGKAVFGDSYDPKHPDRSQADKKLATFLIKLNGALNTVSSDAKYREALEKVKGAKVVSFKNSSGGKLILHPAVRPDRESEWQLSTVGPDGTPYGHNNPPTFEEGVARALNASKDHYWNERGYSLDEIHKSMAAIGLADIIDRDSDGTIYDGTPWERSAPGSKYCAECGSLDAAVRSVVNPALESLRHHVTGAIERGEGVAITEQRADAKITELIRDVKDGDCALSAIFDDGSTRKLFNFYIDELAFFDADLLGKTEIEAHHLHQQRMVAYLQA